MNTRKKFTREFKISILSELENGKSAAQVSRENGIHPSMLSKWKREYKENLGDIIERELKNKNYDPDKVKKGLRGLMGNRMLNGIHNTPLNRIDLLLKEIPDLIKKQSARASRKFKHLFTTQIDTQRQFYLAMIEDLRKLIKNPQLKIFIKDNFDQFQKIAFALHSHLGGTPIEKYSDLMKETGTHNAIVEELYPKGLP